MSDKQMLPIRANVGVYHYRTPVNDVVYASNLRLPRPLAALLLNFNLHGVHHQNPAAPWSRLPSIFDERAAGYQANYFRAAARQLYGSLAITSCPQRGRARGKRAAFQSLPFENPS